jgi:hypothetical protein
MIGGSVHSEAQTHGMSHIGNGLATKGSQSTFDQAHVVPCSGPYESLAQIMTCILLGLRELTWKPDSLIIATPASSCYGHPQLCGVHAIYCISDLLDQFIISQSGLDLDLDTFQCSSQEILHVRSLATSG